jgi:hypothetical protein
MQGDPWMAAMRHGDFEAAWQVSDRVLAERRRLGIVCAHQPRHEQFLWDGSAVDDRRVLVRCYHGLGDTIQFAQLLEPLRRRAREVTLWAQPALLTLLRHVRGIDRLLPLHDGIPDVSCDVDMESMEVAHALRICAADLPVRSPYIDLPHSPRRHVDATAFNVGIAWRAGDWDDARSIEPAALMELTTVPDIRLHSLQYPPEELPFEAGSLACRSIEQMARRMLQLDVVVSVDTMVAHLAAALGIATYLLLSPHPDWRWQTTSRTAWYPSMQIFRARTDWSDVITAAREALARAATATRGKHSTGCKASSG